MTTPTLILRQCRLSTLKPDEQVDIAIADGAIAAIAPRLDLSAPQEIAVNGQLVSPPFVESHIHLDSALTVGQPRWNQSGTLFEGIEIWRDRKQSLTLDDVKQRAIRSLRQQASQGVLYVRSHADVSEARLTALQGLLEVRQAVRDWITLQVVAFPQDGVYGSPQNLELLEEALRLGADAVGGIPHYELTREDGVRSVQKVFELAQKYERLVDIHCDEIDDDQSRFLESVAACAIRSGLSSRVTASHTTAFGSYNDAYALKLMGTLRRADINFIANPLINITLQGRTDTYPKRRGVTRVKELWQNGLNVSLGHDCIQDPWYSLGTGNLLDVAAMAVHVCQMTGPDEIDACYEMVTQGGARTLGMQKDYGIEVGKPANLIVLDAQNCYEAIQRRATVRYVISRGQLLVETTPPAVTWPSSST
ncbi:cytosine deaminase [Romeria aff. gracilis LEGE 07310]|uniref:Cytosine deaminase n=1 Tax=Vasconcelosia minhoensis LEGE 07310 TaxID=915328 RepID=A0A8J7DK02_9CYAN|nr:cytosine deaminase [Romeria gracilis]MBE9075741.1 cytosine deaminase [Romeria aff. gracilis LEGE 07310]